MLLPTVAAALCLLSSMIWCVTANAEPAVVQNRPVPKGFVTTRGSTFELDGKPFVSYRLYCYGCAPWNQLVPGRCWWEAPLRPRGDLACGGRRETSVDAAAVRRDIAKTGVDGARPQAAPREQTAKALARMAITIRCNTKTYGDDTSTETDLREAFIEEIITSAYAEPPDWLITTTLTQLE